MPGADRPAGPASRNIIHARPTAAIISTAAAIIAGAAAAGAARVDAAMAVRMAIVETAVT